jgi:hypothetical protein
VSFVFLLPETVLAAHHSVLFWCSGRPPATRSLCRWRECRALAAARSIRCQSLR